MKSRTSLAGKEKNNGRCFGAHTERRDYPELYPRGKRLGASPKLFRLYQTEVCDRPLRALSIARSAAQQASKGLKPKDLARLQRQEAFRSQEVRNRFRGFMSALAQQDAFNLDDYFHFFPLPMTIKASTFVSMAGTSSATTCITLTMPPR